MNKILSLFLAFTLVSGSNVYAAANPSNHGQATVWRLTLRDRTVQLGLERWAHKAGWQLVWRSKYDMPIEAEVSINGSFEYAVNEICRASQSTGKQLLVEMHDKNKVMVVYTPADIIQ